MNQFLCRAMLSVSSAACLVACAAESDPDATSSRGVVVEPLSVRKAGNAVVVDPPAGLWNGFQMDAAGDDWNQVVDGSIEGDDASCAWSRPVYEVRPAYSVDACPDCALPGPVEVGRSIPDFEVTACLDAGPTEDCALTSNIEGIALADLTFDHPACEGPTRYPTDTFEVRYYRVYAGADAFWALSEEEQAMAAAQKQLPRLDVLSARFRVEPSGDLSVVEDWTRRDDVLNHD